LKLAITIRTAADGWEIDSMLPGGPPVTRSIPAGPSGFPIAPSEEAGDWTDPYKQLATDASAVRALRLKILTGDTSDKALPTLGGYLRAILLGPIWDRAQALAAPSEPIEIEIACDPEDNTMNRLPWEMMMSGERPLGAQDGRVIAVTRLIDGDDLDSSTIGLPLRVLFVIGRQLDPILRPGAEYLGILRQVNATLRDGVREARSVDINLQLLPEATTQALKAAVETFNPAVIHFITHGRWDGNSPVIELTKEDGLNADPCSPHVLIDLIRRKDGRVSPIVVLNACHTGEQRDDTSEPGGNTGALRDAYIPFAAALARGGVAVAVGMAGEVADAACRLFTRAFYQALVNGKPIALAAAFARRASLLHYGDYLLNAEWTRPVLFRNTKASLQIQVDDAQRAIARAAFRFRSVREPSIFCDRIDAVHAYQRFRDQVLDGEFRTPLAIEVSDDQKTVGFSGKASIQIGKSRLVTEIASNAVLQGLAPCVLTSGPAFQPPPGLLLLAIRIAEAMDDAREFFGLAKKVRSAALRRAFRLTGNRDKFDTPQMGDFKDYRNEVKTLAAAPAVRVPDLDQLRDDLKEDVGIFLQDLAAQFPGTLGIPHFRAVLVLIDDLHKYEAAAIPFLELVRDYGIAPNAALAFTYSKGLDAGPEIAEFVRENLRGFVYEPLKPFRDPVESRLAYTQMLLAQKPPLVPSWRSDKKENVEAFFTFCHSRVLGIPSLFPDFVGYIEMSKSFQVLIDADDERILLERLKADG
jgi:hypothetical protein